MKGSTGNGFSRWRIEVANPHSGPVLARIVKIVRERVSPPKPELVLEGASPPKPTRTAEDPPRSRPCEWMRKPRSSSDGVAGATAVKRRRRKMQAREKIGVPVGITFAVIHLMCTRSRILATSVFAGVVLRYCRGLRAPCGPKNSEMGSPTGNLEGV